MPSVLHRPWRPLPTGWSVWIVALVLALVATAMPSPVAFSQPAPGSTIDAGVDVNALEAESQRALLADDAQASRASLEALQAAVAADLAPTAAARLWYWKGRLHERFGDVSDAEHAYLRSLALDAGGRHARHAHNRARNLEAVAAQGADDARRRAFQEILTSLVRGETSGNDDEAVLADMAARRTEIEALLVTDDRLLRVDLRTWLASEARSRGAIRAGWEQYTLILQEPDLPLHLYQQALDGILDTCGPAWRIFASMDIVDAFIAAHGDSLSQGVKDRMRDELIDRAQREVAGAISWLGLAALGMVLVWRRAWRGFRTLFAPATRRMAIQNYLIYLWMFGFTAVMHQLYSLEPAWWIGILGLCPAIVQVLALLVWRADPENPPRGWRGWAVGIATACATFGAVYLPLHAIHRENILGL